MPFVDVIAVCTQLCRDDRVAQRLARDYGLSGDWRRPETLPRTLNAAFGQQPTHDPLAMDLADDIVRWELQPADTWVRCGDPDVFEPDAQERMYRWTVDRPHQSRR